jgi:DNA-binding CsgD family transcriptional regulator
MKLLHDPPNAPSTPPGGGLTPRQEEIRRMLRQGMSNKVIAARLGISEGTVKNHISEIFKALNATNRTQAAQRDRTALLDVDEYLHLAIHANSVRNHHACMSYLKEALQQQPTHAFAIYLLAVQHAEIGLIDRALGGLRAALVLQPQLELARLQLAVMLLDSKRNGEAREEFAALCASRDAAVRLYSEAMIATVDNEVTLAREKLSAGLSHTTVSPTLAALMRRALENIARSQSQSDGVREEAHDQMFLGAYRLTSS